jgi:hypothetical protein
MATKSGNLAYRELNRCPRDKRRYKNTGALQTYRYMRVMK